MVFFCPTLASSAIQISIGVPGGLAWATSAKRAEKFF
jgi:hypothetical protein